MKKSQLLILLSIFLLVPFISQAQPCAMPYCACFSANSNRGCAPLTVTINSCYGGPTSDARYNYDFANQPSATPTTSTTHTYNIPGTYVIMQLVNDPINSNTNYTTDTVVVLGKPQPQFTTALCAGNRIKITIADTNYDLFDVDFGGGATTTLAQEGTYTHTYPNNSSRMITVTGRYIGLCSGPTATKTITPFTSFTTPDLVDLTVTSQATTNGSIDLRFNGIADQLYKLEYKIDNGTYTYADTFTAASSSILRRTVNALNTQNRTYTLRMQNIDMCASPPAISAEIPSIIISPAIQNGFNQIGFNSNGGVGFTSYAMFRNSVNLNNNATSLYTDNAVVCGTDYCYQVRGSLATNSLVAGDVHKSISATACIKASYTGTAPVATNINSTVEDNRVKVVWDQPTLNPVVPSVAFYTVYRSEGGPYNNYGSSNSNSYLDNAANVSNEPYCYEIAYKDACNNVSATSINTCTVHLAITRTDETNFLSWTTYTGYQTGIKEYIVENLDEHGNVVLSKSVGTSLSYSEVADPTLAQLIYRIRVVPNGTENLISYSNVVRIDLTPQVFMPTVFTPNGDGENDILEVKGKYYKSVKMTILNKWGEVIFISEDAGKGWDGSYKGQPVSVDSYAYHVVALDNKGKEISLRGVVSLLR